MQEIRQGEVAVSPHWDDIRVLLAVARAGSLTRAATELGVDQSTVSRRVAALEAELGSVVFIRSKSGLHPTDLGERLVVQAAEMARHADRMAELAATQDDVPTGELRIQGDHWVLSQLAEGPLPAFLKLYPRLSVRLVAMPQLMAQRSQASISLWFEETPGAEEFAIRLTDVPYALYSRHDGVSAPADWVTTVIETGSRRAPARFLEKARQPGEVLRVSATDAHLAASAVRHGMGKALLPVCLARHDPDLVEVKKGEPVLHRRLHLHAHPDTVQTLRVQTAIQWLRRVAGPTFGAGMPQPLNLPKAECAG